MTNKYDLVWEDPPPPIAGSQGVWPQRLAPLKEHPGKWARIMGPTKQTGGISSVSSSISNGKYKGLEAGEFEAVTRKTDEGNAVYARYVGGDFKGDAEGSP